MRPSDGAARLLLAPLLMRERMFFPIAVINLEALIGKRGWQIKSDI